MPVPALHFVPFLLFQAVGEHLLGASWAYTPNHPSFHCTSPEASYVPALQWVTPKSKWGPYLGQTMTSGIHLETLFLLQSYMPPSFSQMHGHPARNYMFQLPLQLRDGF